MNLIKKGTTDVTRYLMLLDPTTGAPETGLTITDLDLQYTRNRTAPAAKVDATALAATDSAHGANKMIQIDATSSPGLYRVDWPDAAFASGVNKVVLVVSGAAIAPAVEEIQLVDIDVEDGVRAGLTALPDAAADAAGGLPISDAGGLDLDNFKQALVLVDTTIHSDDRGKTSCRLTAGPTEDDALIGALVILGDKPGAGQYVPRTITAYTGATKLVTFTPTLTEDADDGGKIWIVPGDTLNKVLLAAIPTTPMRGTDSAATEAKQDIMQTAVDAIPTTPMRGTDNAALASVLGAAVGADISADIAAVKSGVDAIPTTPMRGTDSAATEAKQDIMQTAVDAIPTTPMRGTDGASTFNAGTDEVDVGKVDGVSLAGKVGRNFDFFFQNSGGDTTKEVDDVGGGSGLTDWTASERTEIRQALGVTGSKAATAGGNLDAVKAKTDNLPADPAGISDLAALALEATAQAIKAKTDNLPADPAGISDLAALALEATSQLIKAKTDNLPADPAAVSDLTALALEATSQLIKAKTDNLPADPAAVSDLAALALEATSQLIKAKTDNLPASPAATGDEMALTAAAIAAVVIGLRDAKWTAGGVNTVSDILLAVFAMARGNVYKSGNEYKVYDDDDTGTEDGTLLFTLTQTPGSGERISS